MSEKVQVRCCVCGSREWREKYGETTRNKRGARVKAYRCTHAGYGSHLQIVECDGCGHVYANPVWSEGELVDMYSRVTDAVYEKEREARVKTFETRLKRLEKVGKVNDRGRLLDVGAYTGVFVEVAREAGWEADGLEPSEWAVEVAKKRNLRVKKGSVEKVRIGKRKYDAVTMWDVIEHVRSPKKVIMKCGEMLSEGGLMAVHTIDIDSLVAKLMGSRWNWLMDMHLHYFGRGGLERLVEECGFEVLWSGAEGRYLSAGYLASRVGGMSRYLGSVTGGLVKGLGMEKMLVPVNLGDLMTVYARKTP